MAGLVLADVGAGAFLKARFNNVWPASKDLTLKLFVNDVIPADTDTASTYTEAVGGGYAAETLVCGGWTITPVNDPSDATYPERVFVFTGPLTTNETIYGYYVVDGDGVLQWAEKRYAVDGVTAAPVTPAINGDTLAIIPKFELSKGTPT